MGSNGINEGFHRQYFASEVHSRIPGTALAALLLSGIDAQQASKVIKA
ncbi:hypothetical protein Isolate57596_53050 (plasmid) [Mycobacteroides abscessus subsp. abscessus]